MNGLKRLARAWRARSDVRTVAGAAGAPSVRARTLAHAGRAPAVDVPGGCGWFDSSHDLRCGLAVIEVLDTPLELAVLALVLPVAVPVAAPAVAPRQASRPLR